MSLTNKQFSRYERHITLSDFEEKGQLRLLNSQVLLVGAGGLGVPVAIYIAASGVGKITIVDDDEVSVSNLHRQVLYDDSDRFKPKVPLLKDRINKQNPEIEVTAACLRLNEENADKFIQSHDLVIDACDNFSTRYLLNRLCIKYKKPLISGSLLFSDGQLTTLKGYSPDYPCYQCLYPHSPTPAEAPSCTEAAVLGPVAGVIGTLMAVEVLREISDYGASLAGNLLIYSAKSANFSKVQISKNPQCPVCSGIKDTAQIVT